MSEIKEKHEIHLYAFLFVEVLGLLSSSASQQHTSKTFVNQAAANTGFAYESLILCCAERKAAQPPRHSAEILATFFRDPFSPSTSLF